MLDGIIWLGQYQGTEELYPAMRIYVWGGHDREALVEILRLDKGQGSEDERTIFFTILWIVTPNPW